MGKFYGGIGFGKEVDDGTGIWHVQTTEISYPGEIIRNTNHYREAQDTTNDDLIMAVKISIIADSFVNEHSGEIKYVQFMGTKWKITEVTPEYPHLILTLGGVYNG